MISKKESLYWKAFYGNDSIPSLCMFWKHVTENTENPCSGSPIISNIKLDEPKVDYTKCNGTGIASLTCLGPTGLRWYLFHDSPQASTSTAAPNKTTLTPSNSTTIDISNETITENIPKVNKREAVTELHDLQWDLIDIFCGNSFLFGHEMLPMIMIIFALLHSLSYGNIFSFS